MHPRHIPIPEGCWMCGRTGVKMSNEHIFPGWLLDKYNYRDVELYSTHADPLGRILSRRKLTYDDFVCGRVCKVNCNEGWMSSLENRVKSIYESGWHSQIDKQATLIARWIAKTATTLNVSQQRRVLVPEAARHGLHNSKQLPVGWKVYIFDCPTEEPSITWIQGGAIFVPNYTEDASDLLGRIYVCSLKLGSLGAVCYWNPPEVKSIKPKQNYKQIWPKLEKGLSIAEWDIKVAALNEAVI